MFCPQCGQQTASDKPVCEHCGAPLWADGQAPQSPAASQQPHDAVPPQAPAAPSQPPVPPQAGYPQQPYNAAPPQAPVTPPQPPVPPAPNYYPQQPMQPAPKISNYLAWAIVCIFLCWPLAIPAIVYASKVNNLIAMGDYAGAMEASKNAKTFCLISTILGAIAVVFSIVLGIIGGVVASSTVLYY